MRRPTRLRPALDPLERRMTPGDLVALPAVDFAPLPDDGSDPNASDTGTGYPGDFPVFEVIYPAECSPAGPAF